ncbi:MAG: hypothetical protein PHT43_03210 [Anaerolineaceae bacterium]|nr:hypothetical protein [Anaerolineaceae bacterium]
MREENIAAIAALLATDATVTDDDRKSILAICNHKARYSHRDLISRAEALELLQISGPTLLKFIRAKKITEVRMSDRKRRFIRQEILDFLCHGESAAQA